MAAFDFNVLEKFDEDDGSVTALLQCRPGTDRADEWESEADKEHKERRSLKDEGRDAKGASDALASKMADRAEAMDIERKEKA